MQFCPNPTPSSPMLLSAKIKDNEYYMFVVCAYETEKRQKKAYQRVINILTPIENKDKMTMCLVFQ